MGPLLTVRLVRAMMRNLLLCLSFSGLVRCDCWFCDVTIGHARAAWHHCIGLDRRWEGVEVHGRIYARREAGSSKLWCHVFLNCRFERPGERQQNPESTHVSSRTANASWHSGRHFPLCCASFPYLALLFLRSLCSTLPPPIPPAQREATHDLAACSME